MRFAFVLVVGALLTPAAALAQSSTHDEVNLRLDRLEKENRELRKLLLEQRDDLANLKEEHANTAAQVKRLLPFANLLTGYLDLGFFYVGGDGSGIRPDLMHAAYPEYQAVAPSWTFLGDPLSTAINSRGDPADTGPSRAVKFNPISNAGKASFIINSLTLALFSAPTENLQFNALVDFLPRGRDVSRPGDYVGDYLEVKLGYAQYDLHLRGVELALYAGKFDSVVGYEYRSQDAPDRMTVTPSLICRYTCGRPIGLKARARFFDERLVIALAVTNGSSFSSEFPFAQQIATNYFKKLSGRVSYKFPVGAGLEIGASGVFGAQDFQSNDDVYQWHFGFDTHLEVRGLELTAEYVQGVAQGKNSGVATASQPYPWCDEAPCLIYKGAYGLVGYRVLNWLMPYARVDWRHAFHEYIGTGDQFLYIADLIRLTAGARVEIGTNVILKAEYTYDHKLGRIPQFYDDVFTSSLVLKF